MILLLSILLALAPVAEPPLSVSANPTDLAWHFLKVDVPGICYVGASCYLNQGREAGDIVDANRAVVGHVFYPTDGAIWIKGPGMELDWSAETLDSDANGYFNADDLDLWTRWWEQGTPMADWNGDGWTTGDDFDAHAIAAAGGAPGS